MSLLLETEVCQQSRVWDAVDEMKNKQRTNRKQNKAGAGILFRVVEDAHRHEMWHSASRMLITAHNGERGRLSSRN